MSISTIGKIYYTPPIESNLKEVGPNQPNLLSLCPYEPALQFGIVQVDIFVVPKTKDEVLIF